jgi:glycosyltransferase involved in cell wall biosynthesis
VSPFPLRVDAPHGGRVTASLVRRLAERHAVSVVSIRREGDPATDADIVERCERVDELPAPAAAEPPWRARLRRFGKIAGGPPDLVVHARAHGMGDAIRRAVERLDPDVVQVELHETAQYVAPLRSHRARRVLVDHDPGLPAALEARASAGGLRRLFRSLDVLAWQRYSQTTLPHFDAIVVFTERDRTAVAPHAPGVPIRVIPFAVELPEPSPGPAAGSRPELLFFGGFEHPPNADAARRLARSILPLVQKRHPNAVLALVGAKPPPDLLALASADVAVPGHVPSLAPYLERASVVVVPLRLGGGMRVKVLESLALGKALVASPRAVEGLEVVDGLDLVIADSDDEIAAAISRLLSDDDLRARLGANARGWAEANLGFDRVVEAYEALYRDLIEPRA